MQRALVVSDGSKIAVTAFTDELTRVHHRSIHGLKLETLSYRDMLGDGAIARPASTWSGRGPWSGNGSST